MSRTQFQVAIFIITLKIRQTFLIFVGVIAPTTELIVAYNLKLLHMAAKLSNYIKSKTQLLCYVSLSMEV